MRYTVFFQWPCVPRIIPMEECWRPPLQGGTGATVLYPGRNRGYWKTSPPGWLNSLTLSSPGSTGAIGKSGVCYWVISDTGGITIQ
jgi:hypothetical protein